MCKKVDDFDQYGFAGIPFRIRKGIDAGIRCIYREPKFLLVQNARMTHHLSGTPNGTP